MNRTLAFISVLIASFVLLVHAVVPHHHHNQQVCIVTAENNSCEESAHDDSENHYHHLQNNSQDQDESKSEDCCLLKEVKALPIEKTKLINDLYSVDLSKLLLSFYVEINEFQDNQIQPNSLLSLPYVYQPSLYSLLSGTNVGLRAPPLA